MSGKDSHTPQLSDSLVGASFPRNTVALTNQRMKANREAQPLTQCGHKTHLLTTITMKNTTRLWHER